MRSGFVQLGNWRGVDLRLHWTAFVSPFVFSLLFPWPVFWSAFFALLFVHAFGVAFAARLCHLRVTSVQIDGLGGRCMWRADTTRRKRAAIAWGGVALQLLFLAATATIALARSGPHDAPVQQLLNAWIWGNIALIGLHLLPVSPFAGAEGWQLVRLLIRPPLKPTHWRDALRAAFREQSEYIQLELIEEERLATQLKTQLDQIASDARKRPVRKSTNRQ